MPVKPIVFGPDQRSGDQQLAGASPLAINVVMDGAGAVRRRPGIAAWADAPATPEASPVIGITAFQGDIIFVNEARRIYRVSGGVATLLSSGGAETYLDGTERPTFAVTPWRLAIAGGGVPSKVEPTGPAARLGGSPPPSKQIASLKLRLISDDQTGSDSTGQIRYTPAGDAGNEDWDPLNFTSAEARPDALVALRENGNELFAFGQTSLQVFQPDPTIIFAPGRAMNRGCAAGHSVITVDEQFAWLTNRRELVMSDGRAVQVMSDPIAATLDGIGVVSDCYGFRYAADQFDVLCWQMPSDGRTFATQVGSGWSQWHAWDTPHGHRLFPAKTVYYWEEENLHLVGLADGSIATLEGSANTDLGDTIKAEVVTGFLNRDTDAWKSCDVVRLSFKRGVALDSSFEPQVLLSWRDSQGAFCAPLRLGLGFVGDPIFTIECRTLGMYRARQWKLEFTDAADFVLARVEETFSIGGNN